MEDNYDITKLPFTCISKENWKTLRELEADTLYCVIQHIADYVLEGEGEWETDDILCRVVFQQLKDVIDRKGRSAQKSANNLNKVKKSKEPPVEKKEETKPDIADILKDYCTKFFKKYQGFDYTLDNEAFSKEYYDTLLKFQMYVNEDLKKNYGLDIKISMNELINLLLY